MDMDLKAEAGLAMADLLACMRALSMVHQNAHWNASGEPYYGDHLLYQRLYEAVAAEIDSLAERAIGVFGASIQTHSQMARMFTYIKLFEPKRSGSINYHLLRALQAEQVFLSLLQKVHGFLEKTGTSTMGLDDLLTGIFSAHETHLYLLKQRSGTGLTRISNA